MKINSRGRAILVLLGIGALIFGVIKAKEKGLIPSKKEVTVSNDNIDINTLDAFKKKYSMTRPLRVGVNTWGGYAGGAYFNNGFASNVESEYYKKYGILVDFVLNDDFNASREAWKSGDVDIMWGTVDAFPTESGNLPDNPQIIMQMDWSRGGDAIVATRGINKINDLKGKKVALCYGTPSHSLLLKALESANMKSGDVTIVTTNSAPEAATFFKAGKVDAAVVWSPDDQDCIAAVTGATVILNTKNASNIIADVFFAKKGFIEQHEELVKNFVEGWLTGNAVVNSNDSAKKVSIEILAKNFNQPNEFCVTAVDNVRLVTFGDNQNFFNISGRFKGVKGEELYSQMTEMYKDIGYVKGNVPNWKTVLNLNALRNISLSGDIHSAEGVKSFSDVTVADETSASIVNKTVSITFPSGSFTLTDEAKSVVDREMLPIANQFAQSRIRVSGNTDNVGDAVSNKKLSLKRARSVSDYLITQYNFNKNRFVVVGNGPNKPVADNGTDEGKATNRRTDFEVVR